MSYLDLLPDELYIYYIFQYLPFNDIYKLNAISQRMTKVLKSKVIWYLRTTSLKCIFPIHESNRSVGYIWYKEEGKCKDIRNSIVSILRYLVIYSLDECMALVMRVNNYSDRFFEKETLHNGTHYMVDKYKLGLYSAPKFTHRYNTDEKESNKEPKMFEQLREDQLYIK